MAEGRAGPVPEDHDCKQSGCSPMFAEEGYHDSEYGFCLWDSPESDPIADMKAMFEKARKEPIKLQPVYIFPRWFWNLLQSEA